ncbi:MAG: hypothetical protein NTV62_03145 [Candidatus Gribaldobacteria bacterium]|nr:hypothetical protein [Candidatus Gribaldobacteria bacterium]
MQQKIQQCPAFAKAKAGKQICQNCKIEFIIEPADFDFYEKTKVPSPTWCPECRERRRLVFRNVNHLYKRTCNLCGKNIISRISPDKPYTVYCSKCWWSDQWDPLGYGKEYDFSRPFFEQFQELILQTPHVGVFNANNIDSEWVNHETDDKNCYLNFGGHFNENSAYNDFEMKGKSCFDNYWIWQCELCYENINCERCWKTFFSRDCFDCLSAILSSDCRSCQNILGCSGLRNKQYCLFNQQVSKEEYQKFINDNPLGSSKKLAGLKQKAYATWVLTPKKYSQILKCNNAKGCFITESKNVENAWYADKSEDSKHLFITASIKDSYDCSSLGWAESCYEMGHCVGVGSSKFSAFVLGGGSAEVMGAFNLQYCLATPSTSDCFGCCNLKSKKYCILNKQYTKEAYEELVPRIIQQMNNLTYIDKKGKTYKYGEFFPIELSPFGYNETNAQDYYPLTKEQAISQGFNWSDYDPQIKYEFSNYQIPDNVQDVQDDILEKTLKCEISGKGYKIIPMELQFYRQMNLPIPKRAPLQRHVDRMAQLLPRKLFKRQCMRQATQRNSRPSQTHEYGDGACPNTLETPYSPDRPEIIYCEACYLKEIA